MDELNVPACSRSWSNWLPSRMPKRPPRPRARAIRAGVLRSQGKAISDTHATDHSAGGQRAIAGKVRLADDRMWGA
jgi:hypothetical protein